MLDSVSKAFYIGLTLQVEIIMKTMQTGVTWQRFYYHENQL